MEWLSDPTIWLGLATLVTLEIVLGIDNLLFISILAQKLPPEQREKARLIGLALALLMRLGLLAAIAWMVALTEPWFSVFGHEFSKRDMILIGGGLFLLFKATTELHERMEGHHLSAARSGVYASFGAVVTQIVVLDAVFSLDAIITAVGMVEELAVMYAAVIIAMIVMVASAGPLMRFVNRHPTVVMLCLGFLLMIGTSLIADGFGFSVPKGYLYAAIGFSILIEAFNQAYTRNRNRSELHRPLRERTAEAVLRMLNPAALGRREEGEEPVRAAAGDVAGSFAPEESEMVTGVLTLAERPVSTIMTPRREIVWIDLRDPTDVLLRELRAARHGNLLVSTGDLDHMQGVARTADLLAMLKSGEPIAGSDVLRQPLFVPGSASVLMLLRRFRETRAQLAVVTDEYGSVEGVVTPVDVLEAIAGQLPDALHGDADDFLRQDGEGEWIADGRIEIFRLRQTVSLHVGEGAEAEFMSLAAYLLGRFADLPEIGARITVADIEYTVLDLDGRRIGRVRLRLVERD